MRRLGPVLFGLALSACSPVLTGQYRGASVGPLGCPEDEIEISNHKNIVWAGQSMSWRATCRGRVFLCSMAGSTATCNEEMGSAAPAAPPAAAPAPAGCQYDTQCKGDRICVDGACVYPPAPAAAPSS